MERGDYTKYDKETRETLELIDELEDIVDHAPAQSVTLPCSAVKTLCFWARDGAVIDVAKSKLLKALT